MMRFSTPLAWKNLTDDPRRLLLASAGIGFAAVLMFMQNGFRNALLDSPVKLVRGLDCELIAISPARYALPTEQAFPRRLLRQATTISGVRDVAPLYIELSAAQIRVEGRKQRPIRAIGMPLEAGWFRSQSINEQLVALKQPSTALVDRQSRRPFGFDSDPAKLSQQRVELLGQRIQLSGQFDLGSDFAHEGTLITSQESFARYFPFRGEGEPLEVVDLGLIRLESGTDPEQVARQLTEIAPQQWLVLPREKLIRREMDFWGKNTPVGVIFFVGACMGFAVGVIICYQILFTSIHDAMPEFATLKAMGYSNYYFVGMVVKKSLYLSCFGFFPALAVSWVLFRGLEIATGLPMEINLTRLLTVLLATICMCLFSGMLAMRKLIHADPASLF